MYFLIIYVDIGDYVNVVIPTPNEVQKQRNKTTKATNPSPLEFAVRMTEKMILKY